MSRRVVVVFAKPPQPGRVKTRLAGDLSPAIAASLAAAFLADLLERLVNGLSPKGIEVQVAWALVGSETPPPCGVRWFRQTEGDLGERMLAAARRVAADGAQGVLVGADLPDLDCEAVESAFDALAAGAELVLGPAADGGFYLIAPGEAARDPALFEGVEWGGPGVLARTLANGRRLGLRTALLDEASDVDRPEDLPVLHGRLAGRGPDECPRTRGWLERLVAEGRIRGGTEAGEVRVAR